MWKLGAAESGAQGCIRPAPVLFRLASVQPQAGQQAMANTVLKAPSAAGFNGLTVECAPCGAGLTSGEASWKGARPQGMKGGARPRWLRWCWPGLL